MTEEETMSKVKTMIIFFCLLLLRGSVLGKSLKPISQPAAKQFILAQGYGVQGQVTTHDPDDDDDDDDDSDGDEDED